MRFRFGALSNAIGGTAAGAGNAIANNGSSGVLVESGTRNSIWGNSIFSNGALGIDLSPSGVTQNDPGDTDGGPNNRQNFPVLNSAASTETNTTIQGTLNSTPNAAFRIELFASLACDPSGFGEGQQFLGATSITTDATGNASFSATLGVPAVGGQFITSTATSATNDTSEFSRCIAATGATSVSVASEKKDEDKGEKLHGELKQQRERTNTSGRDDVYSEGNVLEVRCDPATQAGLSVQAPDDLPYAVIGTHDGNQQLRLTRDTRSQCSSMRVGDYVEADGEKQNEQLFDADNLTILRGGKRVH